MAMKSPAFQFYPADFLSDEHVVLMSNQEIGCYIKLMCYCWREGSIPADIGRISRLCGEDVTAMAELWLAIGSCFASANGDPARLIHPRLEKEREKQSEHKKERSESGKKGAEARWGKGFQGYPQGTKNDSSAMAEPMAEPMANDGFSSLFSSLPLNQGQETPTPVGIDPNKNPKSKPARAKPKTGFPENFQLTPDQRDWAAQKKLRIDVDAATELWANSMRAGGREYSDWSAAWRNGMINADKWERERMATKHGGTNGAVKIRSYRELPSA